MVTSAEGAWAGIAALLLASWTTVLSGLWSLHSLTSQGGGEA